jgi:hypothetical protein
MVISKKMDVVEPAEILQEPTKGVLIAHYEDEGSG